jgi:hypothetical protein
MYQECRHIKTNGHRCASPALRGMPYCYFHARFHRRHSALGAPAHEPAELPVMEDRSGIQLAISQVLSDLRAKRSTPREAGLALYAIQIASNTVRARPGSDMDVVRSVEVSEDGDELAPQHIICEGAEDCRDCPQKETCEDYEEEK